MSEETPSYGGPRELPSSIKHVMGFFVYEQLPARLQKVSRPFHDLAVVCAMRAPMSPETTVALRKLLEAKDAAVRAALDTPGEGE